MWYELIPWALLDSYFTFYSVYFYFCVSTCVCSSCFLIPSLIAASNLFYNQIIKLIDLWTK